MTMIQPNANLGAFATASGNGVTSPLKASANGVMGKSAVDSYTGGGNQNFDASGINPQIMTLLTSILSILSLVLSQGFGGNNPALNGGTPAAGGEQAPGQGAYGGGTPAAGNPYAGQQPPTVDPAKQTDPTIMPKPTTGKVRNQAIGGGGPNEAKLVNNTDKPMNISVLQNDAQKPDIITVNPGETVNLSMPAGWAGRINKMNSDAKNPQATLGEVKFDGTGGQAFYDASVIDGYNGAMTITPTNAKATNNNSPLVAGSRKNIIDGAPEGMKIYGANGEVILDGVAPVGDYASKKDNQAYYLNALGEGSAYTFPKDDQASTRTATDNSLTFNFY